MSAPQGSDQSEGNREITIRLDKGWAEMTRDEKDAFLRAASDALSPDVDVAGHDDRGGD